LFFLACLFVCFPHDPETSSAGFLKLRFMFLDISLNARTEQPKVHFSGDFSVLREILWNIFSQTAKILFGHLLTKEISAIVYT